MSVDFALYGYTTNNPPALHTAWNEQKRVVDLSGQSYVFITSLYSSPWRDREKFPNANKSTIKYYWCKYGEKRIKKSMHWIKKDKSAWAHGSTSSKIFLEKW